MRTFLLLIALTGTAWAQSDESSPTDEAATDEQRARELYQNGQDLYAEGAYEAAITAFREAYRLSQRTALLFNIGNAQERLGQLEEAIDSFNQYRAVATPDEREDLSRRVAALERRLREQQAAAAAQPALPSVDPSTIPDRPPVTTAQRTGAAKVMTPVGAIAAVGFGTVAAVTFAQSSGWEQDGNQDAWETWRPVNNASVVLAGTGAAVAIAGLLLPKKQRTEPATALYLPTSADNEGL